MSSSLLILTKTIIACAKHLLPIAKRFHAEKSAGKNPFSSATNSELLESRFNDALRRLGAIPENGSWWRDVLNEMGASYTRPDLFEDEGVKKWISNEQVKNHLITLALKSLIGENDPIVKSEVTKYFMEFVDVDLEYADIPTEIVVAVLTANAHANLSGGEVTLASMVKQVSYQNQETHNRLDDIALRITQQIHNEDIHHGNELKRNIKKIKARRFVPGINVQEEITSLINRMKDGDLLLY